MAVSMRERLIDAASDVIFEKGLGALTFAEAGGRVGLKVTSVTHYFKRRDDLAAACFDRALDRMSALAHASNRETTARRKVRHYLKSNVEIVRLVRMGKSTPIPALSGILSLNPEAREHLIGRYRAIFREIRAWFADASTNRDKDHDSARTHVLLEIVFWLPNALRGYTEDEFDRFGERLYQLLESGLCADGSRWAPVLFDVTPSIQPKGYRELLKAATLLINEQGYRGASVNKIVQQLNLTKGSFYHHLESHEDLMIDCFAASYRTILDAQKAACTIAGDGWTRLASVIASLLVYQFSDSGPLLRTTALQSLPGEQRQSVIEQSDRVARRFSDLVVDAFLDGSGLKADPMVAGQALTAMINAAYVMANWSRRRPMNEAARIYASTVLFGIFAPA